MNALQPWHIIILVLLVVLLFGAKRLPDTARAIGKSMKIFKAETKDLSGEKHAEDAEPVETKQIPPAATVVTPAAPAAAATPVAPVVPAAPVASAQEQQVAALQRQLDELKKQQAAEQPQKNAS
ncbi:Sec-independent protein translocase subunit TatA [Amycolatopsis sp. PS_44_ISF1]|uniref:Sec-independent protein translocase subunit TatA n=1 Tax=Amycolatopsis sp. PS_44_ISF1 TaxID=2974917 RepID=UPI0028E03722|nr:Sec-independent protein translocase subunit TatA [Amycolatopsis sp. PS_44_ISF1]MDT8912707.1 Sec-independent protein translocase subunit TatA [Amycolatopsis sp. PS_44_ISF1]